MLCIRHVHFPVDSNWLGTITNCENIHIWDFKPCFIKVRSLLYFIHRHILTIFTLKWLKKLQNPVLLKNRHLPQETNSCKYRHVFQVSKGSDLGFPLGLFLEFFLQVFAGSVMLFKDSFVMVFWGHAFFFTSSQHLIGSCRFLLCYRKWQVQEWLEYLRYLMFRKKISVQY